MQLVVFSGELMIEAVIAAGEPLWPGSCWEHVDGRFTPWLQCLEKYMTKKKSNWKNSFCWTVNAFELYGIQISSAIEFFSSLKLNKKKTTILKEQFFLFMVQKHEKKDIWGQLVVTFRQFVADTS